MPDKAFRLEDETAFDAKMPAAERVSDVKGLVPSKKISLNEFSSLKFEFFFDGTAARSSTTPLDAVDLFVLPVS